MAKTLEKSRRRPGRPTREAEVRRALAEIGCDPLAIDPLRILAAIAADGTMPPTARVAAARALLGARINQNSEDVSDAAKINERAIARMRVH
jgi:hypothetical protein